MLAYITIRDLPGTSLWRFDGASRDNTDHGRLYVTITEAAGVFTVSAFADVGLSRLVAQGTGTAAITLAAASDSGLTGSVLLADAAPATGELDVFYACDADLLARHTGIEAFLHEDNFAGRAGFAEPCAQAKLVLDALLNARLGSGWRVDDLQALALVAASYALSFLYDFLSTQPGDAAFALSRRFRADARQALGQLQLGVSGHTVRPFEPRVLRA